jgi:lysophospholipase L1-like esterase
VVTLSNPDPTPAIDVRLTADLTVLRPGDTALVRVPRALDREQAHRLREKLTEHLPDVTVLLVGGINGIDVYRPDADAQADRSRIIDALRTLATGHTVTRVWGRFDHATPEQAQEGNAWAADVEDIADLVLRAIGRSGP